MKKNVQDERVARKTVVAVDVGDDSDCCDGSIQWVFCREEKGKERRWKKVSLSQAGTAQGRCECGAALA